MPASWDAFDERFVSFHGSARKNVLPTSEAPEGRV